MKAIGSHVRPSYRLRYRIRGQVQGVGFRPFVYRIAYVHHLTGWIRNDGNGVALEVQGAASDLHQFAAALTMQCPPLAHPHHIAIQTLPNVENEVSFRIDESMHDSHQRACVTVDTAVCPDCLHELFDPHDRRFAYGLNNCTHCGPRYSIVKAIPYDRPNTTMAEFRLCAACEREYRDPTDRRFHAQPIACPACGPKVELVNATGRPLAGNPFKEAASRLRAGQIIAIKGLGGFHLAVRADEDAAVQRLRKLKHREAKPFALMVADVACTQRLIALSERAAALMRSPQCPIIMGSRRANAPVAAGVASDNHRLAVMLPYTPVHHLLMAECGSMDRLVMTSGNISDEPLAIDNREALHRLGPMCDALLWHDRPIARSVDDSIMVDMGDDAAPLPLRRSRGYAPSPIDLPEPPSSAAIDDGLCVGGELKNTVAVVRDRQAILSHHLGDLTHPLALDNFKQTIDDLMLLFDVKPRWIAHDFHPQYLSTRHAQALARQYRIPLIAVQHHHAHAAAVMAEHGCHEPVLAVVCDGMGMGHDGAIWGGELLAADLVGFSRLAHLQPLRLPGGDAAARDTRRSALALLHQAFGQDFDCLPIIKSLLPDAHERHMLTTMLKRNVHCIGSTGAGRYFDGFAALLGLCMHNQFEAQAAMALEAAAWQGSVVSTAPLMHLFDVDGQILLDFAPLVQVILTRLQQHHNTYDLATLIHDQFAWGWSKAVRLAVQRTGLDRVVLSGGVFCNQWLTQCLTARLKAQGLTVMRHEQVPPNDGGIALGQAAIASARLAAGIHT